jgi:hypothetical protein
MIVELVVLYSHLIFLMDQLIINLFLDTLKILQYHLNNLLVVSIIVYFDILNKLDISYFIYFILSLLSLC